MDYFPNTPPDWGLEVSFTFLTDKTELGDGYVQRRDKGINPVRRSWSPTWSLLSLEDKDTIVDFLLSKRSTTPFLFKDPDPSSSKKWKVVCSQAPQVAYQGYGVYQVAATFEEDFNP